MNAPNPRLRLHPENMVWLYRSGNLDPARGWKAACRESGCRWACRPCTKDDARWRFERHYIERHACKGA